MSKQKLKNIYQMKARLAWRGWNEAERDEYLEVYNAQIVENRIRILTQESQSETPVKALAQSVPNVMMNGHQDWLSGLVKFAKGEIK